MPIHVRANKGDYADACLLPGDPLRAKYIAETFMEDVVQRNSERGMLGYTGTFGGKPVSVQSTGMGCPSAAIVIEELTQLGVEKLMRVGTCGGLQPDLSMGDLVIVHMDAPDQQSVMRAMMQSTSDFDTWFRETVLVGVHGFDPKGPLPPPVTVILDHKG